jgi:hypothetical protein
MIMPRASRGAGADGIVGTADDTFINATTPHVDQQQTYASEASSQILLRHYEVRDGVLQDSGRLLNGFGVDRALDIADDGGMATWGYRPGASPVEIRPRPRCGRSKPGFYSSAKATLII